MRDLFLNIPGSNLYWAMHSDDSNSSFLQQTSTDECMQNSFSTLLEPPWVLSNTWNISFPMFLEPTSTEQYIKHLFPNVPGANQYWAMYATFFTWGFCSRPVLSNVTFLTQCSWSQPVLSISCNISYSMFMEPTSNTCHISYFLEPTSTKQCLLAFLLKVPGANQYWAMCVMFLPQGSWSQPVLSNMWKVSNSNSHEPTSTEMHVNFLPQWSWSQQVVRNGNKVSKKKILEPTSYEQCM
jgi:hypothetical protein